MNNKKKSYVCTRCKEPLTIANSYLCRLKIGSGYCKKCDAIVQKEQYYKLDEDARSRINKKYPQRHKKFRCTVKGRYRSLKVALLYENTPEYDLLWNLNFYAQLILDGICHYCGGTISLGGHSLDRKENSDGHRCFNVVPCCPRCNSVKSNYFSYSEMMLLSPTLRKIREGRL